MSPIDKVALAEKTQAEELIAAVPRIPELESFTVRLYEDWTGDPSLYITFRIKQNTVVDDVFLRRYHAYTRQVSKTILHSDISRFPYTGLEKAA